MADSFSYGGVTFPLPTTTTRSLVQDADPVLFIALDFIASMITTYVGGRLLAEAALTGAGSLITSAVQTTLPYEPGPYLKQSQMRFPALFMSRRRGQNEYRTTVRSHEMTTFDCSYVLPPLTAAQAERVLPIRQAIKMVLDDRIEHGWDSNYTPPVVGATKGQPVWPLAGVERIDIGDCTYGGFDGVGELYLPAIVMTLTAKELHGHPTSVVLQGMDGSVAVRAPDGTTTAPVADTNSNTDVPP